MLAAIRLVIGLSLDAIKRLTGPREEPPAEDEPVLEPGDVTILRPIDKPTSPKR